MSERRQIEVRVEWRDEPVRLEAWPEHGAWYEVGRTDATGGVIGSLYAPMYADDSPPNGDDVGEIEVSYEDAIGSEGR